MLHARGIDCDVFEQSEQIRELGVGINTLPHAIKELAALGLLQRLDAVAVRTYELFYTNRFGQEIWREPRGLDAGYDVPQFSIHRGRLQGVIHAAVHERLGNDRVHTGHRLGAFRQDAAGVTAYFFDRTGAHRATAHGDILIGADGIHSAVREALYPHEGPARWNGAMLWRGAVDWPRSIRSPRARAMICALPIGPSSPRSAMAPRRRRARRIGRGRAGWKSWRRTSVVSKSAMSTRRR
jgi:2-polyprenyl-6-methoxyphenol hydroxylase-like FAD-dependent oxidoreductase